MPRIASECAAGLRLVLGDLDAAGLAAAADGDLGLDHARVADLVRRGHGVVDGRRVLPSGTGTPCLAKSCLP